MQSQPRFVLAPGWAEVSHDIHELNMRLDGNGKARRAELNGHAVLAGPHWDTRRRTLYLGQQVVKRFKRPAPNQEAVLAAFEQQRWPERIDDPLSESADLMPQDRLHDVLRRLNHGHEHPLLHFRRDGRGTGIAWSVTEAP